MLEYQIKDWGDTMLSKFACSPFYHPSQEARAQTGLPKPKHTARQFSL